MKKLTLLGALLCATAMQAQTTYYWPGERVTTPLGSGQYFIYNTAYSPSSNNDSKDRTNLLFANGSGLGVTKILPNDFLTTEDKYLFTLEKPLTPTSDNHWYIHTKDGYVGIGGSTVNTAGKDLYITYWKSESKISKASDIQSQTEDGNSFVDPNTTDTKVWTITNTEDASSNPTGNIQYAWNGDAKKWSVWGNAHPYAFYKVESKTLSVEAASYYNEIIAKNGKIADLAFRLQQRYGLVQNGDDYYFSNYPETTPAENSHYRNLVDGDDNTYFHSSWSASGSATDPRHYLCAEVGDPVQYFYIITKRRCDNNKNRPTSILVEGSNEKDAENYAEITTLEGLPTDANEYFYFSDKIDAKALYKYLRFTPEATNTGYRYFTYSEFYIIPSNEVTDAVMAAIRNFYNTGNIRKNTNVTDQEIIEAGNAFDAGDLLMAKDEANALLLANASNYADDPELGQYPTTAYNTFKDAVSTSQTSDELVAAINTFKLSINSPVFLINGTFDGWYKTIGQSIYYSAGDADHPLHWNKATNKYDKTMLWKFIGLDKDYPDLNTTYSVMNLSAPVYLWGVEHVQITNTNTENADGQVLIMSEGYEYPLHAQYGGLIVRYQTFDANTASAWTLQYVGESYDIEKIDNDQLDAYAELKTLVPACEPFKGQIGTGLNQFTSEGFESALEDAEAVIAQDIYENPTLSGVTEARDRLKAAKEALTINQPETGKFYRIKNESNGKYICSTPVTDGRQSLVENADDKTTVYYLSADNRLTNSLGINIAENSHPAKNTLGTTFEFLINNNGYYMIKSTERVEPLYAHNDGGDLLSYDFNGGNYADNLKDAWTLEPVTATDDQPVITKQMTAEYATIAAPVALNVPSGVTAYTVKVEGEVAKLTELSGVIPAGVPAVIKGTAGKTYTFTFAPDASTENNTDLRGVYVETKIPTETVAYVLAVGSKGVGFYLLSDNADDRTLAANKAYLVLPAGAANVKAFILNTGDLTGIESVATGAEAEEYYDLQGRRVMKPTKGIYVTKSGKKVIF